MRVVQVNAESRSRELPTASRAALKQGLGVIETRYGTELGEIGDTIAEFEKISSDELDRAVRNNASCAHPIFRGEAEPAADLQALFRGLILGDL